MFEQKILSNLYPHSYKVQLVKSREPRSFLIDW